MSEVIRIGCSDSEEDEIQITPIGNSNRRVTRSSAKRTKAKSPQKKKNVATSNDSDSCLMIIEDKAERKKKTVILEGGLEVTIDDDSDEEIEQCIRVVWSQTAEVNRFNLKPSETIASVFDFFSKKYNLPVDKVKIRNGDNVVSKYNTIQDLKLRVTDTLEAYEVKDTLEDSCKNNGPGKIEIKCLLQSLKKPIVFYLHNQQQVADLLPECAKEARCSIENLVLKFDGEKVEPTDTPISLALDGGECFEVHVRC